MHFLFKALPGLGICDCSGVRPLLDGPVKKQAQNYSSIINYKVPDHELWMAFFHNPARTQADLDRCLANVQIITGDSLFGGASVFDTDNEAALFTNNASGGGTCFGSSGSPIFWADTNIVAAVTSYGINQNCVQSSYWPID